ncbi:MAG TPA: hypothetical protein VN577_16385 [Terriglobales bacterium]|nr:hypothetical protein [Terriglobales bacterium]
MASPLKAIFWGGFWCGILDISSAMVAWGIRGVKPIRILQSVASGALGRAAFDGGWSTALLGLGFHFTIAFTAATVYYLASRKLTFLVQRAVLFGMLYGEFVFLFMHYVVVPLSRAQQGRFTWASLISGPVGHLFFVGLPIALAIRKWAPITNATVAQRSVR